MEIIEKYAYYKLHRKARTRHRQVKIPVPDYVRKVGVLWRPSEKEAFQYLRDYFLRKQAILRNLCIYAEMPAIDTETNAITPANLNWLGFPKSAAAENFIKTEFDLLMNISLEQNRVLDYLTALSVAKFKIGWSPQETNFFDLNIRIEQNQNSLFLAKQQIYYLEQLNKTTQYDGKTF